uniref:isochorismate synthase n=1 Tax=Sciadococcus taiwanensis TaxID=3028030 RepID=A0A9Y1I1X7_9RHOD|nr:isochorismate synthase [Sciadococcus taiwanensis]
MNNRTQSNFNYKLGISKIQIDSFQYYWTRIEFELNEMDPLTWLSSQTTYPRMYWSSRDTNLEIACLNEIFAIHKLPSLIQSSFIKGDIKPQIKLFGIHPFNKKILEKNSSKSWESFHQTYFFLPEFEIIKNESRTFWAFNKLAVQPEKLNLKKINKLVKDISVKHSESYEVMNSIEKVTYSPRFEVWCNQVESILEKINFHGLEKVVIARQKIITFTQSINPLLILKLLKKHTPNTYNFAIAFDSNSTFIGLSPERLYKRDQVSIETEAIAGTRPRGISNKEDMQLSFNLLKSAKDLKEIDIVYQYIKEKLNNLCEKVDSKNRYSLIQTHNVQHLYTRLNGNLQRKYTDKEIIKVLHPTPAICGIPVIEALNNIDKYETFNRGGYGSPIGWIGENSAYLSIAIRSALIKNRKMIIFAGCGIVQGSNSLEEWNETENKMSQFNQILSIYGIGEA